MFWIIVLSFIGAVVAVPADICDQTFEVLQGQTRTINFLFDTNYPGNANCVFHLRGTGAERLRISFTEFDIEKHARCNFDSLEVFNGPTIGSPPVRKLCGYEVPSPFETNGNVATLRFTSDRTLHKTGFILQFATKTSEQFSGQCEPTFTKSSGGFESPLYPNNYPNRVNCNYEIAPSTGNQILIQFPTFQLERSSSCVMDYVTISTRSKVGEKLCGDLDGNAYLVSGSLASINFVSDRSSTRRGFELTYRTIQTCKDLDDVCEIGCRVGDDSMLECTCKPGFQAKKGEAQCTDVNECLVDNGGCTDQCKNTEGSFQCGCSTDGFFLAPDGFNCTDRSCAVGNAGCEHNCHLTGEGGYFCTCNKGFRIMGDQHNCSDINECTDKKYQHSCEQRCINDPGSYYCDCDEGYILSYNQRKCNDVDECVTQGLNCDHECRNYPGGWSCSCYQGYQVNPTDPNGCIDINECQAEAMPAHCKNCVNFEGGFSCIACEDGFTTNNTACLDIDECDTNNGGCQQECLNFPGTFKCNCQSGHELIADGLDGESCQDINECEPNDGLGPCEHYCENSIGSFTCHCLPGYELTIGSGIACQDIDECATTANGNCKQQCNNHQGSYSCSCFPGYWMTDGVCQDIDECVEDKPCDKELGAECVNTLGSFHCICPSGFNVVNASICEDIDECANGTFGATHGCSQQCVNTPGSYRCDCHDGYADSGNDSCVDINECHQKPCWFTCENTIGSFQCSCPPGYFLLADGLRCSDVDECAAGTVLCDQECRNLIGHYECACYDGYELTSDNYTCSDIDECSRNISDCSDGCVNTRGSYRCYCFQGYKFTEDSNSTCEDTDECATDNGGCHHVCENTLGSFSCGCHDGYETGSDDRCHDTNECQKNNGGCGQTCSNFDGGYNCTCDADFKLGDDDHSCSHCPSCEMFEQVQADVESMKQMTQRVQELIEANMRLAATVSRLEDQVNDLISRNS
ncbi:uncharacterized protein LOC120330220 [Styela clava]